MASKEISDIGLSVVYEPPEGVAAADIVFIHGLQGHPLRTWSYMKPNHLKGSKAEALKGIFKRKTKASLSTGMEENIEENDSNAVLEDVFWPRDLLPQECGRARILTWGYNTIITKFYESTNKNNVFAHAKNLLAALKRERPESRPIIFVAHSLGGILVKEVLRRSSESTQDSLNDIVRSTSAVVFLGTPHRGSAKFAGIGDVLRQTASIFLRFDSNETHLRVLGADNPELELSHESFTALWKKHRFSVKTFQESTPLTGVNIGIFNELVVPKESSSLGDPEENAETIEANHHTMCKFNGASDPGYLQVSRELQGFVNAIVRRNEHEVITQCGRIEVAGLEAVGDVLRDIPLITSVLDYYIDGASNIKGMEQYENVFIDSKSCLDSGIFMFRLSCRELVRDLPDKQIRDLVDLRQGWD
jgi:hypothetical protein